MAKRGRPWKCGETAESILQAREDLVAVARIEADIKKFKKEGKSGPLRRAIEREIKSHGGSRSAILAKRRQILEMYRDKLPSRFVWTEIE
jgi:hypothetical protein